ncbi:MAG: energy-coupling factor transporter ATPase [Clostridia bacterium]|nr:energy-coupling factor transporter ATPase [Clostridia bacterium]
MNLIETKALVYYYGAGTPFEIRALDCVDLSLCRGGIKAVIGHTGSGKSTLIQHFNALLKPASGKVFFQGKNINESKESAYRIRFKIGLCFQYPEYQLFEDTVYRDIAFGPKNMGLSPEETERAVKKAAAYVGIEPELFERSPFELSGGQKRRIAIAGVMAMDPDVLILDEPTAGLDPSGREMILRMICDYRKKTDKTVMLVSHSMDDVARIADEVIVVDHGKIAMQGSVEEIFSHSSELTAMGLSVPEVTGITDKLRNAGCSLPTGIYTVEQAADAICAYLSGRCPK